MSDSKVSGPEIESVKMNVYNFLRAQSSEGEKTSREEAVLQLGATVLSM